jgi:endonuclease YncB( thermonuclease family)
MTLYSHRGLRVFSLVVLPLTLCLPVTSFAKDTATIVRVVDGDTLEITLQGQPEKVRLIGINTPEKYESDKLHRDAARTGQDEKTIQALGERAFDFTKSLVKRGAAVQLEYDQQLRDKYQRLLSEEEARRAGYKKAKNCP